AADPAPADVAYRCRVEEVELLPTPPERRDEVGVLEDGQVLAHRLPGHAQAGAELGQRLTLLGPEAVQKLPPARVGQRSEHLVQLSSTAFMQPFGCLKICNHTVACQGPRSDGGLRSSAAGPRPAPRWPVPGRSLGRPRALRRASRPLR